MQIHELNTFSGTPGANDYFATDNGADTSKISAENLLAPLNERIDNIIAGPAPSAEEIVDARLGADGVTYPSLGDAIRDQVSDLKSDLSDVKKLDNFDLLAGIQWENKSVNTSDGSEFASGTRILSGLIDLSKVSKIKVSISSGYRYYYHLYDANQNWISAGVSNWQTATQTIDPPSAYIKFLVSKTDNGNIVPADSVNFNADGTFPFNVLVTDVRRTFKALSFEEPLMRNGTIGNKVNANGITTEYIIPLPKRYDFVMLEWTGFDISSGEDVGFGYCVYDNATDGMTSTQAFDDASVVKHNYNSGLAQLVEKNPILILNLDDLRTDGEHFGVCVFRKKNGEFVPLRIDSYQYSLKITYGYYEISNTDTSIIALNPDARGNLLQANRPINASANSYLSVAQPVTLLHFSDIHADSVELKRMVEFLDRYSSLIDNAICTGDMVNQRYSDGMTWWSNIDGADKILLAIGNHDALADPSGYDWTQLATQADQYSQYFAPYIANWGCTYTANKTYYYKDYTAKKIRLIVLNCMLVGSDSTEQLTWLTNTLASAKVSGLSVVIAVHYMPYNSQKIDCNFSTLDRGVGNEVLSLSYLTAVQDFVADGGEFVCYIAGHVHYDIFVKSISYPNQMCICIDALNVYQSNVYSDTQRTNGTKSQDLANLITFDTASKVVKINRVGADTDHYLRSKKCMTFKYLTGEIICEF